MIREHGTTRGYRQHMRAHEATCEDCRAAWAHHRALERYGAQRAKLEPVRQAAVRQLIARHTAEFLALVREGLSA